MKNSLQLFLSIVICGFIADRMVFEGLIFLEEKVFTGESVGKLNVFLCVKDSVEVLVFGSSRAVHHVNPEDFNKSAFNIGVNGTKVGYSSALISTLESKKQFIIVHIDPHEIFDKNYEGNDGSGLLYKSFSNDKLLNFFKIHYPREVILSRISKCYVFNGKVLAIAKNFFFPGNHKLNHNGYVPLVASKEQQKIFNNMLVKQKGYFNADISKPLQVNPKVNKFVDDIIRVSIQNESKLLFFTSPSLNKVDSEVIDDTVTFFAQKDATYIDYTDFFDQLEVNQWQDYKHLSIEGAKLFSKELAKSCESYFGSD